METIKEPPKVPTNKPDQERQPKLMLIIGTNGTGKSTFAKKMLLAELKKPDGRALIVTPHDMEWQQIPMVHEKFPQHIEKYVKARRMIFQDEQDLEYILKYFSRGLLIFDDCRAYFKSSLDAHLHRLLISRRQLMMDIIAVGHGFTEVPPKFFTFATHLVLFRTTDNIARRKDVLRDFEAMEQAQQRVNQAAIQNPHHYEIIPVV